jgi:hypothetical protein
MRTAISFGIVLLIALVFVVLPGGGDALNVALTILSIAFFTAIALLGVRLYREYNFTLTSLSDTQRLVLYASIAGAVLTFTATSRLFDAGGGGVIIWIALLGACSYGLVWVYTQARRYG